MANFFLCPWATVFQYFTDTGVILSGGLVYTYLAGTTTPQVTYTDITGTVPNANPIVLASNGRLPSVSIWQPSGVAIKIIVTDSNGNQLGPTFDQLTGINDLAVANSALENPASGFGADLVANAVRSYDIFSTARAANVPVLQSGQTLIVDFEGGITVADGLGGRFYWNASSSASDDNLNVLAPTALAGSPGRYLRLSQALNFYAVKGGTTSRASTTTLTIDPDLQISLPNAGTYAIESWLNDATGTSAGGLKGQVTYSGGVTNGFWGMTGSGTGTTPVQLTGIGTPAQLQSAQTGVGSMVLSGMLQCTNGGILSFNWAQESSNSTASVLGPGSYLHATRLSSATGSFNPITHTYSTVATGVETVPSGASTLTIEVWGGTGGGGRGAGSGCVTHGGGGGGGGGYSLTIINVASANGQTLNYAVGAGGSAGGGGAGSASSVTPGTFAITAITGNGGSGGSNATGTAGGAGGPGGTATGGNTTNTTGNSGSNGDPLGGAGGTPIAGINGSGTSGGRGGNNAAGPGVVGNPGVIVFHYV